jgi:hypothetical protein
MSEHAVDPSTLPDGTPVEIAYTEGGVEMVYKDRGGWQPERESVGDPNDDPVKWDDEKYRIVAVLHRADECPPAEQWRQVTPEEVREGWLVEKRRGETLLRGRVGFITKDHRLFDAGTGSQVALWDPSAVLLNGWTLWTNEPADPDAAILDLIDANVLRLLRSNGYDVVEVDRAE